VAHEPIVLKNELRILSWDKERRRKGDVVKYELEYDCSISDVVFYREILDAFT